MPEKKQPWEDNPKWFRSNPGWYKEPAVFQAHLQYHKTRLDNARQKREYKESIFGYIKEATSLPELKLRLSKLETDNGITALYGLPVKALNEIIDEILEVFYTREALGFKATEFLTGEGKISSPEQAGESFYERHLSEEKIEAKTSSGNLDANLMKGLIHFKTNPNGAKKFFELIKSIVGLAVIQEINKPINNPE